MGRLISAHWRQSVGLCAIAFTFFADSTVRAESRVEFRLQREATVRLDNGSSVRGKLKSISPAVVVVVMKDGTEKEIPFETMRIVSTNDKAFTYNPASEDMESLLTRASKMQGATVHRDASSSELDTAVSSKSSVDPDPTGGPPQAYLKMAGLASAAAPEANVEGVGGVVSVDGFGGASLGPRDKVKLDTVAVAALMSTATEAAAKAEAASRPAAPPKGPPIGKPGEIVICANPKCRKTVNLNARYGDQCPHCGVVWVQESAPDIIASAGPTDSGPTGSNPFGSGKPAARATTAQSGPATSQQGVAGASPTVAAPQSFDLESVPWWGKMAGFFGLLAVLWFLSQRR